jgi:hypothetical protein
MEHMRRARVGYADGKLVNINSGTVKRKLKKKPNTSTPSIKPLKLDGLLPAARATAPSIIPSNTPLLSTSVPTFDQFMEERNRSKIDGGALDTNSNATNDSHKDDEKSHMGDVASLASEIKKAANSFVTQHRRNATLKHGPFSPQHQHHANGNGNGNSNDQWAPETVASMLAKRQSQSPDPDPFDMGIRPDYTIPVQPARPMTAESSLSQSASDDEYDIDISTGRRVRKQPLLKKTTSATPKAPDIEVINEHVDDNEGHAANGNNGGKSTNGNGSGTSEAGWWRDQIDSETKKRLYEAEQKAKSDASANSMSGVGNGDGVEDERTLANRQRIVDRQQRKHHRKLAREARAAAVVGNDDRRTAERKKKARDALNAASAAAAAAIAAQAAAIASANEEDARIAAEAKARADELRRTVEDLGFEIGVSRPVSSMAREAQFLQQQINQQNGDGDGNDNDNDNDDDSPDDFDMSRSGTGDMQNDGQRVRKSRADREFEKKQKARNDDHTLRRERKQARRHRRHAGEAKQSKRTTSSNRRSKSSKGASDRRSGTTTGSSAAGADAGGNDNDSTDDSADDEADSRPATGASGKRSNNGSASSKRGSGHGSNGAAHNRSKSNSSKGGRGPLARVKSDLAQQFDQSLAALTAQMAATVDSPVTRVGSSSGKFGHPSPSSSPSSSSSSIGKDNIKMADNISSGHDNSNIGMAAIPIGIPTLATVIDNEGGDSQRSITTASAISSLPSSRPLTQTVPPITEAEATVILNRIATGDSTVKLVMEALPSAADFQKFWLGKGSGLANINNGRPLTAEQQMQMLESVRRSMATAASSRTPTSHSTRPTTHSSNNNDNYNDNDGSHYEGGDTFTDELLKKHHSVIGNDGLPVHLTSLDTTGRRQRDKRRADLASLNGGIDEFAPPVGGLDGDWSHRSAISHLPHSTLIAARVLDGERQRNGTAATATATGTGSGVVHHHDNVDQQRLLRTREQDDIDRRNAIASRDRRRRAEIAGQQVIADRVDAVRRRRERYRPDGSLIMPGNIITLFLAFAC